MDFDLNPNILPAALVILAALAGIVLTLITLPGTWVAVVVAALVAWWRPDMLSWYTVVATLGVAILAELVEFLASAMGASKGGSTKKGALGALLGSIAGAILGSPVVFPLGTILGAVIGAAVGTFVIERGVVQKTWGESTKAAGGAALGRAVATVAKTALAALMALILIIAVLV